MIEQKRKLGPDGRYISPEPQLEGNVVKIAAQPFKRRWPPRPEEQKAPGPKPEVKEEVELISKGTITRLSAIADQGVEYNEEDAEPEPQQTGQLVPFEPEPEDEARPPPIYTPKEIIKLNRQHAVIANLGGKCVIMEFVPSNVTPGTTEPA
jgi:hypothetical protein